jgi:hypothetical protein
MTIGNIDSAERGSGARYNDGKVLMEFIPARILADFYANTNTVDWPRECRADSVRAYYVLDKLADFEESKQDDDWALIEVMRFAVPQFGTGVGRWRDIAGILAYGAEKYAPWNWAKGMPWSVPIACIKRHAVAVLEGEADDPESGMPHLAHVGANVAMLMHYLEHFQEGDDRAPVECFGGHVQLDDVELLKKSDDDTCPWSDDETCPWDPDATAVLPGPASFKEYEAAHRGVIVFSNGVEVPVPEGVDFQITLYGPGGQCGGGSVLDGEVCGSGGSGTGVDDSPAAG